MIDFTSALIFFDCPRCYRAPLQFPEGHCDECGNTGEVPFYLGTLLANLAIAGALCASWEQGYDSGEFDALNHYRLAPPFDWEPNVDGRAAPGMGGE